jgi:hypothetical protein
LPIIITEITSVITRPSNQPFLFTQRTRHPRCSLSKQRGHDVFVGLFVSPQQSDEPQPRNRIRRTANRPPAAVQTGNFVGKQWLI